MKTRTAETNAHVYITKFALTKGISKATVISFENTNSVRGHVVVHEAKGLNKQAMYFGNEWYHTKEAAKEQAERMRLKKIESLEKQLSKFKAMNFGD